MIWRIEGNRISLVKELDVLYCINCLRFSPDGDWIAFGKRGGIGLYCLETGQLQHIESGGVQSLDFSPNGSRIASAHRGEIKFWDPKNLIQMGYVGVGRYLTGVRFINDQQVVYVSRDAGVSLLGGK